MFSLSRNIDSSPRLKSVFECAILLSRKTSVLDAMVAAGIGDDTSAVDPGGQRNAVGGQAVDLDTWDVLTCTLEWFNHAKRLTRAKAACHSDVGTSHLTATVLNNVPWYAVLHGTEARLLLAAVKFRAGYTPLDLEAAVGEIALRDLVEDNLEGLCNDSSNGWNDSPDGSWAHLNHAEASKSGRADECLSMHLVCWLKCLEIGGIERLLAARAVVV